MAEQLEEGGNGWLLACTSERVLDCSLYGARSSASRAAPRTPVGVSDPSLGQRRNPRELSLDSVARG